MKVSEFSLQRGKTSLPVDKFHGPVPCIIVGCCDKLAAALDSATAILLFRPGFCRPPSLSTVVTKLCFVYTAELNKGMTYQIQDDPLNLCLCDQNVVILRFDHLACKRDKKSLLQSSAQENTV